jgi:hypothetical protein
VRTILQELLQVQDLKDGLQWQFTIDGEKKDKVYSLYFPILFLWETLWSITSFAAYVVDQMLHMCAGFATVSLISLMSPALL